MAGAEGDTDGHLCAEIDPAVYKTFSRICYNQVTPGEKGEGLWLGFR